MARRSPYTQAAMNIVAEYARMRKRPTTAVPFGQEKVSKKTLLDRLAQMSLAEREAFVAKIGEDSLWEMLK